ncbi:AAA family ATPase, partial [Guyparkeria halopsychrophila]|uniref:AAA family ATPase n=1 Tax=Guyparkeria halopsychrophila TaxID=3139421 RepID=UPI0037C6CBEF
MKSVRIQNLRALHDTDDIDLRPLTICVGKNSSGKSSFARFFPLLRQSVEQRTTGPILWYG